MATTLADIHQDIIHAHILPRLDGRSLSTTATLSSSLHALTSDYNLWSQISMSTWPSITNPCVDDVISNFPGGHRSFFEDSFPSLITEAIDHNRYPSKSSFEQPDCYQDCSTKLISAIDIHYQTDIIYSAVRFTDTTTEFLSSELQIKLNEDNGIFSRDIYLEVDELAGVDESKLSHVKESLTLNWILINPSLKRAGNLSSIKAVNVKKDWVTNETIVIYDTVLPGCDPNEMVRCRIQVVLGVGNQGKGLYVKEVVMKMMDLDSCWINGREFLVISERAILGENNVKRKVVDDDDIRKITREFKEIKSLRKELKRKDEFKRETTSWMNYGGILVSFCFSLYFLSLLLQWNIASF